MSAKFEELMEYRKEIKVYENVETLLNWDMETATPKSGIESMIDAVGVMSTKAFEMSVSEKMEGLIKDVYESGEYEKLDKYMKKAVEEMKRELEENKRIPVEFYNEYTMHIAKAQEAWRSAKRANDYAQFKPYLQKNIEYVKKLYEYSKGEGKGDYNSMLDDYERGMDMETIDRLFLELKEELIPLVKAISQKPQPACDKFKRSIDVDRQRKFSKFLLEYIGFDLDRGVMAESEHPFTTGISRDDVRLTNHYYENDLLSGVFSIIHEGGHGIFEQNVHERFDNTPLASCCYMGLHESQSRFFENILGKNINFWKPIMPKFYEIFPEMSDVTVEELYHEVNKVQSGLIRIESDEVTYCFHIILRYELEKGMFGGDMSFDDLPKLWEDKMMEYLFIKPENDAEGVMQDTHWSGGSFGYFPSYLLGSIYDGMFLEKIEEDLGSVDKILEEGRIKEITKWLNEKIHTFGCYREPKEVIEAVCGKELSVKPLVKYFKDKYTKIYEL